MYRDCKSYSDQSLCVSELAVSCIALKRKNKYSSTDARSVVLDCITSLARSCQMILNLLDSWTKGDEPILQAIPQLIGLTTVTNEGVQMAGSSINAMARLGFVVLAQFQIENALRNIARELKVPLKSTGFYRTAVKVLEALTIPLDRMEKLNTPARIRNSLHTNGIYFRQHPTELSQVTINGVTYNFEDGKQVTCAKWEHIAHALEASIGVLDEVFSSPLIQAIPDPMQDQYAREQETKPKDQIR